jgi:hypothetical protein
MKNGKCSKCGSASVYSRPNGLGFGNMDKVFIYGGKWSKPSSTTAYVCATCGYFEVYLSDASGLAEMAKLWSKVPPRG